MVNKYVRVCRLCKKVCYGTLCQECHWSKKHSTPGRSIARKKKYAEKKKLEKL